MKYGVMGAAAIIFFAFYGFDAISRLLRPLPMGRWRLGPTRAVSRTALGWPRLASLSARSARVGPRSPQLGARSPPPVGRVNGVLPRTPRSALPVLCNLQPVGPAARCARGRLSGRDRERTITPVTCRARPCPFAGKTGSDLRAGDSPIDDSVHGDLAELTFVPGVARP